MRHAIPTVAAAIAALGGCQTYEPAPLDLASHRVSWESRTPGDEEVRRYAEHLASLGDAATPDAYDPSDGLSLAEGEVLALVYNADLRLARLRAGVTAATAEHAGLWEDPTLDVDVLGITRSVPDPWIVSVGVGFTIPLSGRLEAEKAKADAAAAAALDRVALDEWTTTRNLRHAWLEWSADQLRVDLTEGIVAQLDSVVASTSSLADAGELSRPEATLFAIEHASRRNELVGLHNHRVDHEQEVRATLGLAPDAPVELQPALAAPPLPDGPWLDRVAASSLELAAAASDYEIAEHALDREVRKQFPDITLGPQYESDEGQSRVGFVAGIPIPVLNANQQGIAEARAERDLARAAYETEFERLAARLARARARYEAARSQREDLETTLVPLVDRQVDDARRLMELGEGAALVLLESVVRAHETKLHLIDARLTEAKAAVDVLEILGPTP